MPPEGSHKQGVSQPVASSQGAFGKLRGGVCSGQDARPVPTGWPPTIREVEFQAPTCSILMDMRVESSPVRAVVDTAGQVTVLSEEFFRHFPPPARPHREEAVVLKRAGKEGRMPGRLVLGPFPKSAEGNVNDLVVVDQFTKWTECFALPHQSADLVARTLINEFFARFGCPSIIHSDQGPNFESNLFAGLCELLQIAKTRTTPYHPCSTGQVERANRSILQMIRCFLQKDQQQWDLCLPQLAGAIRGSVNRSTGFTPNMLMLGREVSLANSVVLGPQPVQSNMPTFVLDLQERCRAVHEVAREHLGSSQLEQARVYNSRVREIPYSVGDLVYVSQEARKPGVSKKPSPKREGPHLITEILSPSVFQVKGQRRSQVVHHNRLMPYREEAIPLWCRRARSQLLGSADAPPASPPGAAEDDPHDPDDPDDPLTYLSALFQTPTAPTGRHRRPIRLPVRLRDCVVP